MTNPDVTTRELLERLHRGDEEALRLLVERHLPWLEIAVREQIGPVLRRRGETGDYLHEAVVHVLRYGPKFVVNDEAHCRAILARMIRNFMHDQARWWQAKQRSRVEGALPSDSVAEAPMITDDSPIDRMQRDETHQDLRLAVEFLPVHEREVLILRYWQDLDFEEISRRLSITAEGARTRHHRALKKLSSTALRIRGEQWQEVLGEE